MTKKWIIFGYLVFLTLIFLTASGDTFVLGVYGNANMDDTINDADITYVEGIISGSEKKTQFADANNDGNVDESDIQQIKDIMAGTEKEIIIEDYDKKVKTIKQPAERIITSYGYITEAAESLGKTDKIIAVDESTKDKEGLFHDEVLVLPSIGVWDNYDLESIIELKPDLVLIFMRSWLGEGNQQMDSVVETAVPGSSVVAVMPRNKAEWMGEVAKMSYTMGASEKWNELKSFIESTENTISNTVSAVPEDTKVNVLILDMGHSELPVGIFTAGKDSTGLSKVIIEAGGKNIGDILPGDNVEIDSEWVIEQNPDAIVIAMPSSIMGYNQEDTTKVKDFYDKYTENAWIQQTNAYKNNRIYLINWPLLQSEWFNGLPYLAKMLYPDLFENLNPQELHQEFLDKFMDMDYNLQEHGVFAYPGIQTGDNVVGIPDAKKS